MQKFQKDNYTLIKIHRLIVLFHIIRKAFELILARKISTIIEINYLLINAYCGGRNNMIQIEFLT